VLKLVFLAYHKSVKVPISIQLPVKRSCDLNLTRVANFFWSGQSVLVFIITIVRGHIYVFLYFIFKSTQKNIPRTLSILEWQFFKSRKHGSCDNQYFFTLHRSVAYPEIFKGGCLTQKSSNNRLLFRQTNTILQAAKYFYFNIILKERGAWAPKHPLWECYWHRL
jgi:hypothetical protein